MTRFLQRYFLLAAAMLLGLTMNLPALAQDDGVRVTVDNLSGQNWQPTQGIIKNGRKV